MKKLRIFFPLIAGTIVGFSIMGNFQFYKTLVKPFFAPPNWIFPFVWTILYLLMGVSYYITISKSDNKEIKIVYYLQLFLNLIWPIVFFAFEQLLVSSVVILFLDFLIILMISNFSKIDKKAGYLQIPYFVWTFFATTLNISILLLN